MQSKVKLANRVEIPRLGLGVYQSPPGRTTRRAVKYALSIGYRHVDTASLYGNEQDVGIAVRESGLDRNEVFVTTKVWNSEQGYDSTLLACEGSLRRLGFTHVDLYLIHWPVPTLGNETWRAMVRLYQEGKVRAIGVSNYDIQDLKELLVNFDIAPVVNQVEFHPFLYQHNLLEFCEKNRIQVEAYSPLTRGERLTHPKLSKIAKKYGKTSAQKIGRAHV